MKAANLGGVPETLGMEFEAAEQPGSKTAKLVVPYEKFTVYENWLIEKCVYGAALVGFYECFDEEGKKIPNDEYWGDYSEKDVP